MALSGSFHNYPVSEFGLYCTWSAVQNTSGNYSDVTLNVYLRFYTISVDSRSDSTISINGTTETYTSPAIDDMRSTSWHNVLLKSKTVRVYHDNDGTKANVPLSASWRFSGTYSGVSVGTITASDSITLNPIDRYPSAPTSCTAKVGSDSTNYSYGDSVTIAWSGASGVVTGYEIQYATKGQNDSAWGSWTAWKTVTGTSTTDSWSSLMAGAQFKYRVRAMNGSLPSSWKESNAMTVRGGMRRNVSGSWKMGTVWIKVSGAWRRAKCVWINVGGTWRRSI